MSHTPPPAPGAKPRFTVLGYGSYAESLRIGEILRKETVGGALLVAAAVIALAWANSPASESYFALRDFRIGYQPWHLELSLGAWAADGLLAIFFFLVGLELKREFVAGDLRQLSKSVVPVAAAAGLAVLDVIEDEGLIGNAKKIGNYLMNGLREIGNRHIQIGDVRGSGLFIGLELVRDRDAKEPAPELASQLINRLRHRGILIGAAGPYGNTLKIRPPLCFTEDNADMFIAASDEVLREICPA
jgi:hypothetical protein